MKTIAVWNIKGGVGKTTTVMTTAYEMAKKNKKVLLLDIDPQANLTAIFLKEQRKDYQNYFSITDILKNMNDSETDNHELVNRSIYKVNENIDMIGSELSLSNVELKIRSDVMIPQLQLLTNVLDNIDKGYDYILIDCPPQISLLTLNALIVADEVIIPINVDDWANEGFDNTMRSIKSCNKNYAKSIRYKVLFTMLNRSNIDRIIMNSIKSKLTPAEYFNCTIRYQAKPIKESKQKEISVTDYKSNIAEDYKGFVEELMK